MHRNYIFLGLAIVFNFAANFTLKAFVANRNPDFISQLKMIGFYAAIGFFGINFMFYAKALQNIPISLAYPIVVGLSVVGLVALSLLFLGERVSPIQAGGIFLVIAGIALITR